MTKRPTGLRLLVIIIVTVIASCDNNGEVNGPPQTTLTTSTASSPPPTSSSTIPPTSEDPHTIYPNSAEQVANLFGGTAGEWTRVGSNGWVYGSKTSGALRFQVPSNCLVDTVSGRHGPGTQINATALTIYWVG